MSKYFFATLEDGLAHFDEHEVHHLRVMRYSKGSEIKFTDGNGKLFLGKLINRDTATIVKLIKTQKKPLPKIYIISAPVRWERTRFMVEKSVELGVSGLIFMNTNRTTRLETESKLKKVTLIARNAIKQCGSLYIPSVLRFSDFDFPPNSTKLMLDPEGETTLSKIIHIKERVVIAVGPEGGFTKEEKTSFESMEFKKIKMGSRILRTETAVIVALTAINILSKNF